MADLLCLVVFMHCVSVAFGIAASQWLFPAMFLYVVA